MENCIFCKIIKGEIPCNKVYEDEIVFAFLDNNPVNLGHTLISPKKHFENIFDIPEETAAHIIKIAKKISLTLKKIGIEGVNLTMNNGKVASQVVFHSHTHIIPRLPDDDFPLFPTKKFEEKEMSDMAQKIIAGL